MKNLKYLALLHLLFFISYKSYHEDLTDGNTICKLYQQMDADDQKYRTMMDDGYLEILDSIQVSEGITTEIYSTLSLEKQREYVRRARIIAKKRPVNQKRFDSLMNLQIAVDNKNTELLMKIIKKNEGFPDIKTLPCKRGCDIVFMHAPEKYWPELRILIENEFKAGRIYEGFYNYMQWHMGGRKPDEFKKIQVKN